MTPGGRTADERPDWSRWIRYVALGLLALLVVVEGLDRLLSDEAAGPPADPPDLPRWKLVGCWELDLGPWRVTRQDTATTSRDRRPPPRSAVPVAPPRHVMLLPDSVDPWGRALDSRRALPVGEAGSDGGPPLRWLVRADTLWLVWSQADVRGGIALRQQGARLRGRARAVGDSVDASARAEALRVSCSTLERMPPGPVRR